MEILFSIIYLYKTIISPIDAGGLPVLYFEKKKGGGAMRRIAFSALQPEEVQLRLRIAFEYQPRILKNHIFWRICNSLMYLASGQYEYAWNGQRIRMEGGCLYYLPHGCAYDYQVVSDKAHAFQMEFTLQDQKTGDFLALSDRPCVLMPQITDESRMLMQSICQAAPISYASARLRAHGDCFRLLGLISASEEKSSAPVYPKISPAIEYIERHFAQKISTQDLLNCCYLSEAHMRRLFFAAKGMSPHQYHAMLRMNAACEMLKHSNARIGEIAFALGFESVYTFSQIFKRETGMSPRQYQLAHGAEERDGK